MDEAEILYILEQHDFDTSLDWRDPEIGFSADELLAMAEWVPIYDGPLPTIETHPIHYAPDLHVQRLPDWIREPEVVHVSG